MNPKTMTVAAQILEFFFKCLYSLKSVHELDLINRMYLMVSIYLPLNSYTF